MSIEKEPNIENILPDNFNDKVKAYKDSPPTEMMIPELKDLADGSVLPENSKLHPYFGDGWTSDVYKQFLEKISISSEKENS